MFGFKRIFRKFTQPSSDTNIAPMTIVGDYTKESEEQSITPYAAPVSKGAESGIITLPLLSHYSNLARGYESMYNDGLVGQRDGDFPVTNPVDGKIYFHPASKKYYLCTQGYTGTVDEPGGENVKFSELTLYNVSKTGGTKQVTISGVITGNGSANNAGVINIASAYGAMSSYAKGTASAVTTSDTPITAIGKLEALLDTKSASNHNHDTVYSKLNHTHVWANITDRPSTLPNPNGLVIKLNGGSGKTYTGSEAVEIDITPSAIGAQVAGDYAAASHNHNGVYAPVSHSHSEYLPLAGGSLTGDVIVPKEHGFKYYDSEGTAKWLISNNGGTEIALGYSNEGHNVIVRAYNEIYAMKDKKVWHEGNFNPSNYSATSHNHDDRYFTESEINDKLGGYAVVGHNHDTAYAKISHTHTEYQPKGDYAASNHNHDSVYAKISHSHTINQIGALTGYEKAESAKAVTAEDTILVAIGKLEKALDGKQGSGSYAPASHTHVWANITDRPSTLPNPHALTISLNGKAQTAYTGSAAVEFNITPASIGAQVAGSYASASHNHDGVYQPAGDYALANHNHDETYSKLGHTHSEYAPTSHNHNGVYAPVSHTHTIGQIGALTGYKIGSAEALSAEDTILTAFGKLEASVNSKQAAGSYAPASHTHDDRYFTETEITSKLAGYSLTSHNHDSVYAKISHGTHVTYATEKPLANGTAAVGESAKVAREDHVHPLQTSVSGNAGTATKLAAARTITLTGDASGSASFDGSADVSITVTVADDSHTHSWGNITGKPSSFTPSTHNQPSSTITAMTGYAKASAVAAISASDNLNVAIGKLEKALDSKQAAGSYAPASHNHDDRYYTESEINSKLSGYSPTGHTHTGYLSTSGGTISGALTVTGQILSNADVVAYSDARFKTNLRKIEDPISKLNSISGYHYDMLGVENNHQVGVIAQEVEKILPEAVFHDNNGHMGVRYTNLIPLLIEGFKEQQREINELKELIHKMSGGAK